MLAHLLMLYTVTMRHRNQTTSVADNMIKSCWIWPDVFFVARWLISGWWWPQQTTYTAYFVNWKYLVDEQLLRVIVCHLHYCLVDLINHYNLKNTRKGWTNADHRIQCSLYMASVILEQPLLCAGPSLTHRRHSSWSLRPEKGVRGLPVGLITTQPGLTAQPAAQVNIICVVISVIWPLFSSDDHCMETTFSASDDSIWLNVCCKCNVCYSDCYWLNVCRKPAGYRHCYWETLNVCCKSAGANSSASCSGKGYFCCYICDLAFIQQ